MQKTIKFIENYHGNLAFVLNLNGTGLGVIRSLGERGIDVIGLTQKFFDYGVFSKYCRYLITPNIEDEKRYPLGRYGQPKDIAFLAVFLLSDASVWMTGSLVTIDGGVSLK